MTTFDEREQAFEDEFAHNLELQFRVKIRRNRMIAAWTINKIAEQYEGAFVKLDFELIDAQLRDGDEAVIDKIINWLAAAGIWLTPAQVRFELDHMFVYAKREIMSEIK